MCSLFCSYADLFSQLFRKSISGKQRSCVLFFCPHDLEITPPSCMENVLVEHKNEWINQYITRVRAFEKLSL